MKVNIAHLQGYGVRLRGKPVVSLIFNALDEWIEYNVEVPRYIAISKELDDMLASENNGKVDSLISLIGEHEIIIKDLDKYTIEFIVY